jgi:hypothetical protein
MPLIAVEKTRLRKTPFPVSLKPTWSLGRAWSGVARAPGRIHTDQGVIVIDDARLCASAES